MILKEITGYKWVAEQGAINAKNSLRVHYLGNRPAPPAGETWTTTEWVQVKEGICEGQTVYYFAGNYSPVLGLPTTFNIEIDIDIE